MITKQQQAVADIAAQGPDGFADRVEVHAARLYDDGDMTGLADFVDALEARRDLLQPDPFVVGARVCCAPGCGKAAAWSVWPENARRPDYCEPLTCNEHLAEYGMTYALGDVPPSAWRVFEIGTTYGNGDGVSVAARGKEQG